MQLNLRRPTLVISGLWNPAIFQPPWIAVTLLDVPPGDDVDFVEVMELNKASHYFGEIGIALTPGRLELFSNVREESSWKNLEQLALKVLATLPHTPISGFGVNFRFEDGQPDPTVIDKLWTNEGVETRFEVLATAIRNKLKFDDCELNFMRETTDGKFTVDFNFHHGETTVEKVNQLLPGVIANSYARACAIMSDLYEVEVEEEVISHQLPAAPAA